ncbi:unnamed protein product, partial [Meganyctiphanes norvegica]
VAVDPDSGNGGEVRYTCDSGCDNFFVEEHNGRIILKSVLDAEREREHSITVIAQDLGAQPRSATTTIVVEVLDLNDNPPVWESKEYKGHVSPEAAPGHIITAVRATDADISQSYPLQYRIHGGDNL